MTDKEKKLRKQLQDLRSKRTKLNNEIGVLKKELGEDVQDNSILTT